MYLFGAEKGAVKRRSLVAGPELPYQDSWLGLVSRLTGKVPLVDSTLLVTSVYGGTSADNQNPSECTQLQFRK